MENPRDDWFVLVGFRYRLVEPHLGARECCRLPPVASDKDKTIIRFYTPQALDDLDRSIRERDCVLFMVLGAPSWDRPKFFVEVDFSPARASDLAFALAGQNRELDNRAKRPAFAIGCLPHQAEFNIIQNTGAASRWGRGLDARAR